MGRVHVSVFRHLAWVSAANLSPVRTQTHSMQGISTSVGVSSVSQHAFCAHGSEWGGKISTRISYLVISEDKSSVTVAHIKWELMLSTLQTSARLWENQQWLSAATTPAPPVLGEKSWDWQLFVQVSTVEVRGQFAYKPFKNIFELKSMEVTEERRDTAERIQNIWCFLMTVKVSSYQKVSQRSLHVLSVLHH